MRCHRRNQITAMSVLSPISAICIPFFKASRQLYLHIPFQFMMDIIREPNEHDTYRTVGGSHVKLYEVQEAVSHLQLITDEDATKENKFVVGMCLKITMSSTSKSSITTYNKSYPKAGQGNKQARGEKYESMVYRRMFTFADLENKKGGIFVMFEKNLDDQKRYESNLPFGSPIHVGGVYAFIEPSVEGSFLGPMMSIITSSYPLYPLRPVDLTDVPYKAAQENTSRYFILKNVAIDIDGAVIVHTNCTGRQCDRRDVNTTADCGCSHYDRNAGKSHVIQCDVVAHHPSLASPIKITNWSSLSFTEECICDKRLPSEINMNSYPLIMTYRRSIKEMVEYVNQNGGFDTVWWHRLGLQKDASASASSDNQVLAERPTLHLEVLRPADVTRDQLKTEGKLFRTSLLSLA